MLLNFSLKNYKSFKRKGVLSMQPAPKITDLPYSLIKPKKHVSALPTAVIYGPNASGKTNIISALFLLRHIVLQGKLTDSPATYVNHVLPALRAVPNLKEKSSTPTALSIDFLHRGIRFTYTLRMRLGRFMGRNPMREIVYESLEIDRKTIYVRDLAITLGNLKMIQPFWNEGFNEQAAKSLTNIQNINTDELFLTSVFKSVYSLKIVTFITEWFAKSLRVVLRADQASFMPEAKGLQKDKFYTYPPFGEAVRALSGMDGLYAYAVDDEDQMNLYALIRHPGKKSGPVLPIEEYESLGTVRFLKLLPVILETLKCGLTLVIDEYDASLHPSAVMSIIKLFHNPDINKKGAQLIFNTHNPIFLNADLFRRDEIIFTERNEDSGDSEIYKLSDFGTSGRDGVRKGEDYMKHYFIGRYGAMRDIDFTPLFIKGAQPEEADSDA